MCVDGGVGRRRCGLVIGAGAALGGAWALGALCALQEVGGFDAAQADVVVGTSAGSVLVALIACGVSPDRMADRLTGDRGDVQGTEPVNPLDAVDHVGLALVAGRRPLLLPGNLALAVRSLGRPDRHTLMTAAAALAPRGRGSLEPVRRLVAEHLPASGWPESSRTWLTAMDFDSGRRVVFGRSDGPQVALPDAVMASCAAPGYFPPVPLAGRRYVDGGAVSVTNADVLVREGLDEILVLAPMALEGADPRAGAAAHLEGRLRHYARARLDWEVRRLRAAGAQVRVLAPTGEDLTVIGSNVMDPRRRRAVFEIALRTTAARLDVAQDGITQDGITQDGIAQDGVAS